MKVSDQLGSQLPKINLKKFDTVRNNYGSLPSFFETPKQANSEQKGGLAKENILKKPQQENNKDNRRKKSLILFENSSQKLKYQTKSLSFHKTSSKALLATKQNYEIKHSTQKINQTQKKSNLRQIDAKFVLQKMPRLKMSKSQQKINITTNTKYENWFPKKNNIRQIQNIRNENYLKIQKFQDSFFFKYRNNSSLLKLTRSQQIER